MLRFFLFSLVAVTIGAVLHETRPTMKDFRAELDQRFLSIKSDPAAFSNVVGTHPLDHLVMTLPPWHAVAQTRVEDYKVFQVFTTQYQARNGLRQVQTLGLGQSFFTLPDRAGAIAAHQRRSTETDERARSARW